MKENDSIRSFLFFKKNDNIHPIGLMNVKLKDGKNIEFNDPIQGMVLSCSVWGATAGPEDYAEPVSLDYVADFWWKPDNCTHWWFSGEDSNGSRDSAKDYLGYYHLCGVDNIVEHIALQALATKTCIEIIGRRMSVGEYEDNHYKLLAPFLENFEIREITGATWVDGLMKRYKWN